MSPIESVLEMLFKVLTGRNVTFYKTSLLCATVELFGSIHPVMHNGKVARGESLRNSCERISAITTLLETVTNQPIKISVTEHIDITGRTDSYKISSMNAGNVPSDVTSVQYAVIVFTLNNLFLLNSEMHMSLLTVNAR